MKNVFKFALMLMAGASALIGCQPTATDKEGTLSDDEKALQAVVEQYVPHVIYSIYGSLADQTETLTKQLVALRDSKSLTQKDIDEVCATFLSAREYWEKSEAFLFGPATAFGIDPHIDSWPLDKDNLAQTLSNEIDFACLEEKGAEVLAPAVLGFHGIEFILFRDGKNRTVASLSANETDEAFTKEVSGHQELVFAAAVAEDLYNSCARLEVSWNPAAPKERKALIIEDLELPCTIEGSDLTFGENLLGATKAGSTYGTWQEAVAKTILSGSVSIADEVANTKMGTAHYVNSVSYDKDYIESPYSHRSFYDFRDNILSIQYSLYGGYNLSAPANASLMTFMKNKGYKGADALDAALKDALSSLQACISSGKAFVEDPTASYVETAIEKINVLSDALDDASDWIVKL